MFALVALLGLASTSGFSFGSRSVGVNVHGDVTALKMVRDTDNFMFSGRRLDEIVEILHFLTSYI